MIPAEKLRAVMPNSGAHADTFAPLLTDTASRFGIDTPRRVAAWLANIAEETEELTKLVESMNYKDPARLLLIFPHDFKDLADAKAVHARGQQAIANRVYANQNGNGNEASGDGWTYRGRGGPMCTGRANYAEMTMRLDVDVLSHPELLEDPKNAADAAGCFWKQRPALAAAADAGDIVKVRKIWNGGAIGLPEVTQYYRRAVAAFCL